SLRARCPPAPRSSGGRDHGPLRRRLRHPPPQRAARRASRPREAGRAAARLRLSVGRGRHRERLLHGRRRVPRGDRPALPRGRRAAAALRLSAARPPRPRLRPRSARRGRRAVRGRVLRAARARALRPHAQPARTLLGGSSHPVRLPRPGRPLVRLPLPLLRLPGPPLRPRRRRPGVAAPAPLSVTRRAVLGSGLALTQRREVMSSRGGAENAEFLRARRAGLLWLSGAAETSRRDPGSGVWWFVPGESAFAGWSLPRPARSPAG